MEWVAPIHVVEYRIRKQGVFMLVDLRRRSIWFFGCKAKQSELNSIMDSLKGRTEEMVNFLLARASVKGETK